MSGRLLVYNIGDLLTLAPLAQAGRGVAIAPADLGRLGPEAYLVVEGGKVQAVGRGSAPTLPGVPTLDAQGGLVMPGLVDAHTHPIFGGNRAAEFCQRAEGATYQEIAAAGGGIRSTVRATAEASDEELRQRLQAYLDRVLPLGITTLEVKSGYGLTVASELRLLRLLQQAMTPQHLEITCLALHARSAQYANVADYVQACSEELLPEVAAEGLAKWVDAFIEDGYFSATQAEPWIHKAKDLGFGVRLHADEFSDGGGAMAAARWGAASADHLQWASDEGLVAMARTGVTATLLPGTSLYSRIPFVDGRRLVAKGVAVAVASDFNPGSCAFDNLAMLATIAAVHCGLRPAEAIAAVTLVPALSLGLGKVKGALAPGFDADFLCFPTLTSCEAWLADAGKTLPGSVYIRGRRAAGH